MIEYLYTDGGTCSRNPSPIAGSWAWLLIYSDSGIETLINSASGVIEPSDVGLKSISSNFTELYAAVRGLEALKNLDWNGTLFTDSLITLYRLTRKNSRFNGIPKFLESRVLKLKQNRKWSVELLSGHPTKIELAKGISKEGRPVSKWNALADEMCTRTSTLFKEKL